MRRLRQFIGNSCFGMFLALMVFSLSISTFSLYGQTPNIGGPGEIDKCDIETYTITVTNNSTENICSIVVTNTLPNSDFSYVTNSATLCFPSPGCASCNLPGGSAEPSGVGVLTWNIDTLCGGTIQLAPGESFTIEFQVETNCDTVSGTDSVRVDYEECANPGTPLFEETALSIQVNPGAVTINKTPAVPTGGLNDTVTWDIIVTNTGLGAIKNVVVTDTFGSGLQYVTSTPVVTPVGNTLTFSSTEIGGLAEMAVDAEITIPVEFRIIACDNLDNVADVRWGCDGGPTCFDTAVNGGTATASVQFEPTSPFLVLTPPNINLDYCEIDDTVVFQMQNTGTGTAYNTELEVNLGPLSVSNIQDGVIYSGGRFTNIPDIDTGTTFNLTFDVSFADNCNATSGQLLYIPEYRDECNNPFYPTPVLGTYNLGAAGAASLTVSKTGPGTLYIGETADYDINVTYSGPTSCGSGTTGAVTVVDTIPADVGVINPGSGVYDPNAAPTGNGSTGGTITWTFTPPGSTTLNDTVTLQMPGRDLCETYCNSSITNSIAASVTDCCGCTLSASDSAVTYIECDQLNILTSSKTAAPASAGPCQTLRITSEYAFEDNAGLDNVDLEELTITENNDNGLTYAGLVSAAIGGTDLSGCIAVSDNTPTGTLVFTFPTCGYGSVRSRTLTIVYDMLIDTVTVTPQPCQPVPPCGNSYSWYDWTDLDLGPDSPSGQCLTLPGVHETVGLTVTPPYMRVSMTALPNFVENCGTYDVDITVTQTSDANPYDVRLVLENTNYYTIQILDCNTGDVQPAVCDPGSIYSAQKEWTFDDVFTSNGTTGIIRLRVQKRCSNSPDLVARLYYDDLCHDDSVYDDICETSATSSSLLLLEGDIFIEKTPEVIFAETNQVTWTIYVTNAGDGSAANITIEDTLAGGHTYASSTVTPDNGDVTTTPGSPANGVTWVIDSMPAGEVRTITVTADLIACQPLGNSVEAYWGCDFDGNTTIDEECEREGPVTSDVKNPTPNLVSTSLTVSPQDMCSTQTATISLRNAGQTNVYELIVAQDLPEGLSYAGNPQYQYDNGGFLPAPPPVITNPTPTTSRLTWTFIQGDPGLLGHMYELPKGIVLQISFDMTADCDFAGGFLQVETNHKNPCGEVVSPSSVGTFVLGVRYPEVTITKTRTIPPEPDAIECGQQVTWEITVTNTGDVTNPIQVLWLEDTLDPGFTFVSATGGAFMIDNGFNGYGGDPQLTTFEIRSLPRGASSIITLVADSVASGQPNCADLTNTVTGFWGCGTADGDSSTKPGVDEAPALTCLTVTGEQTNSVGTRVPPLDQDLSHSLEPSAIPACGAGVPTTFTLTITNNSSTSGVDNLDAVINLPTGLEYVPGSSTVTCPGPSTNTTDPGGGTGPALTYYNIGDTGSNLCDSLGPGESVTIVFDLLSDCYLEDDITVDLYFYDCCDIGQLSTQFSNTVSAEEPDIAVTKTPDTTQVDCGANVTWTITVTNNGTGNAGVVRVEDTPGAWVDVRTGQPGDPIDMGGGVYGWEINNLARSGDPGDTAVFTLVGTLNPDAFPNQDDCAAALRQNNVEVFWGCGSNADSTDNDPTTTGYDCTAPTSATAGPATLQMPDLVVTGITPDISCTADGTFSGSIQVTVLNQGDGTAVGGFQVQVDDGNGWTGTGSYGIDLAAAGTTVVNIDVSGWNPDCTPCTYNFTAQVDIGDAVCECREDNNNFGPQSYSPPIPDLEVASDTLTITCVTDGQYRIAGNVTLRNDGCAGTLTQDVPMRFTLLSGPGCGGAQVAQWTQTFTGVNIAAGGTQTFAITNYIVVGDACGSAAACQFSIRIEADYSDTICECDGTDNTLCSDKTFSIADLRVDSETLAISCTADGQFRIQGNLTIANDGCGANLVSNIPIRIRVYNNNGACTGANGVTSFTQTGVNIPAGGTQTFAVNRTINRNLCINSTGCQVAVGIELDYPNVICECTNTNNTYCAPNKTVPIPDLQVSGDTLDITCLQDGQVRVSGDVTIANTGCNTAVSGNLPMRFTLFSNINCGGAQLDQWTETFVGANIAAGSSQVFTIANRDIFTDICSNSTACQVSLRIEADPGPGTICECSSGNNTRCTNKTVSVPDLRITSVTPAVTCNSDGNLSGTVQVTVNNNGCGAANGALIRLTSDCGIVFADQLVDIAAGDSTTVTFNYTPNCGACTCTFTAAADPENTLCECDGTNNTLTSAPFTMTVPDLVVQGDNLAVNCLDDGQVTVSGTVTLRNDGCGNNLTTNIPMRFTLHGNTGCGGNVIDTWTDTFSSVNIASGGGAQTFTITSRNITTDLCSNSTGCQFSIFVEPDHSSAICECDGTNNNYCADNKNVDIPDLEVSGDTLGVTCFTDGQVTVSGTVTMANNGCGSNLTDNIPVQFTLYDNTGCSGNVLDQWTETLAGVNISAGGSQSLTITPRNITSDLVTNSTGCQVSIRVEADYNNSICECDGTDNTYCADNKNIDIPDLQISSDTLGITCLDDGQFTVSGTVTMANNGCGSNLTDNIPVQFTLYDNTGCSGNVLDQWTETLAGVNIPAGGATQVFTITPQNITANLVINSTGCQVSIRMEADYNNTICESDGTDNSLCSDKTVSIPDLTVNSITPSVTCIGDGNLQGTVTVNVGNIGCGAANNVVVRLAFDCGVPAVDQTVNIGAGSNQNVVFNYTPDCANCTCIYTVTMDPLNNICESDGTNNSLVSAPYTMDVPDLLVQSDTLAVNCSTDGQVTVSGSLTVQNDGCGANLTADIPVRFTLYDNTGCSGSALGTWTETFSPVNIPSGSGTQTFTITPQTIAADMVTNSNNCRASIGVELDHTTTICECDGANNTYCADNKAIDIPDVEVSANTLSVTCFDDGQVTISGNVTLANNGCGSNLTSDVDMRFTLYDNTGCSGNQLLTWTQTFSSVNIPAGGGTQVFAITSQALVSNLVDNSTNCEVSIRVEADYTNAICESDGTDNTYCADNIPVDIPDLEMQSETIVISYTDDGQVQVSGDLTLVNNGCGSDLTLNIPVRFTLFDNINCTGNQLAQWTETLSSVNMTAGGGTQVFTVTPYNMAANLCTGSTNCQVSIRVELDYTNVICESDGTDNTSCADKTIIAPDFTVNSVASTVICLNDGNLAGTTVNVGNTGCGDAANVTVRLIADCGLTFADQTIDLAAGETTDVFFAFTAGITDCTCNFTATIDPDNTIPECDGTNNTQTSTQGMLIPDLEIRSEALEINCVDDGVIQVSGTVTMINNGCGPNFTGNIPMRFTLFDNTGSSGNMVHQWTQTFTGVNLPSAGGTQTFTIQLHDITTNYCTNSTNCMVSILMEADYPGTICEWDGSDNTYSTDKTSDCLDLEAEAIIANTNCTEDGTMNGTVAVTVRSSGGNPITEDFSIRVDDGQGWTSELRYNADLGGTLPLAGGAASTVTFTWERDFTTEPFTCNFDTITARVDSQNEICQCDTQNDMVATTYSLPLPNLVPTAVTPSCSSDGNYEIEVEVENNGCTGADAGSFIVHLEDSLGHSADSPVSSLGHGETFTAVFSDWPASCEPNTVTFIVTVDYNNDVCEITGTDNSMEYVYTNTSPDLVITDAAPSTIRTSPGTFEGTITVTVMNTGNGAVTEDFKIICNDGEGWSTELFYQADLNGTLPIPPGGSTVVAVNWNRSFADEPYTCDYNNITVSIDMGANVCECAADNNDTVTSFHLPYPDLYVQSLLPYCTADGMRSLEVVIGNQGCEDQNEDFDVTFIDSTGQTRTVSFRSLGGRLPLKVGEKQKITLEEWEFDCTGLTIEFTVTLDPRGAINDLQPSNTFKYIHNAEEPDLQIGDIQWTCNPDGSVSFTVTVVNEGVGDAVNAQFIIYDASGNTVFSQRIDLAKGASKQFSFTTNVLPKDESLTFRFTADEEESVCECNGTNNEKSISIVCPAEEEGEPELEIGMLCPPGQQAGGLFRFEIQLENTGEVDAEDVTIEDRLPDGFQYVGGSSVLDGQQISDPTTGPPLVWQIGTLEQGRGVTLTFTAVADADIDPGRYINESRGTAAYQGGTGILTTDWVNCSTVIPRVASAGCCLKVEEWPMGGFRRPEGPLSFIEPYFHTETAMFTVYSIFNLWENAALEKGTMPLFMKERLNNYARSTIEEFYLASQLGLTLPDGTLWLSYAGAYPEKGNSWVRKQVDETMTVSQVGFELLALNETVKVEEREEVRQTLKQIIDKKLAFLAEFKDNLQELPHGWEIKEEKKEGEEQIEKLTAEATLYDKTALYLAMVELNNSGYKNAGTFAQKLRELLKKSIDNMDFDGNNLREEFIFILALLETGQTEQAKAKIKKFEEAADSIELKNLHDYALAAAVDYKAGGTLHKNLEKEMEEKYYLKDTGIFAEKQPDFTFKLNLNSLAPVILSFDTEDKADQAHHATVLYRTFDEVGLFLKKRNLSVGKPLYSLLKNYPFTDPLLPVLTFTRANRDIAPVFSQDALVHSTQVKPLGEVLIPRTFSKILSPSYETKTSRIAAVSFALQYIGRTLKEKEERVIKEEGRSFDETGKTYIDSLLKSGAGIQWDGYTLLPFDHVAVKGPKQGEHNLEPLDAGTGAQVSTETLANYLLAEKWYVEGEGKYADTVQKLMAFQDRVVGQFKETGYIPEKFSILIDKDTGKITVIPSKENASKLTAAKLFHVLPVDEEHKFLEPAFKQIKGELLPEDLIFFTAVPELVPYFKEEIQAIVDYKDARVSHNAADIIGRRLLGDNEAKIQKSLENLKTHWDKEAVLPTSDRVENIEKGLIYHHEPQQLLLYLEAAQQGMEVMDFRFKRTLNFFTYLLENEWGVAWNSFITLPSAEFQVFREEPREHIEPGDLVNFRVRVDNTCPEGFGSAWDLASLFLRATFSPALVYTGTQWVEGLDVLGNFQWRYHGFPEGAQLEYFYQAYVPYEFQDNFIDGSIYAGGRQGYQEFDPQSATGDDCEDVDQTKRMNFIPWEALHGRVFEDTNVNGTREEGELGIPNILIKDTRGRLFRSDADGGFDVLAGDEHEGLQLELKSLPPNYLVFGNPTRLVNRHYIGEISFALIPCKTVEGFVYVDGNQNGTYDEGESRPVGVQLRAKGKEVITGKDGVFIFRNLPLQWQQWIEINKDQLYYKGDTANLKIHIEKD